MTDKAKSPDQIIHEEMGLCWHEPKKPPRHNHVASTCLKCGKMYGVFGPPGDYAKYTRSLHEWMRGIQFGGELEICRWVLFGQWIKNNEGLSLGYFLAFSLERQRDLIAQWIESTRE